MATFTITDGQDPFLHVGLCKGESIYADCDAMMMMEGTLDLIGNVQGGLLSGIARQLVAGESRFTQKIVAVRGDGDVLPSQVVPGALHVFDVGNRQRKLSDGAFLAAETSVEIKTQSLSNALFGGIGGLFIMEPSDNGKLCVGGFGSVFLRDIKHGQNPVIHNGHVIAWDAGLSYELTEATSRSGGLLSNLVSRQTSGEGLVMKFAG